MNRVFQDRGFQIHLAVFVLVNALLAGLNLWQHPDKLWFYWVLIGWGLGLLGHAFLAYRAANRPVVRANIPRPTPRPGAPSGPGNA